MKKLLFLFVLFAFYGSTQVTHQIYNLTDFSGTCTGYNLFASFNNGGLCPPTFSSQTCFDVPIGLTQHEAENQSCSSFNVADEIRGIAIKEQNSQAVFYVSFCDNLNNFQLNGGRYIQLMNCIPNNIYVEWNIDVQNNSIIIKIQ